MEYDKEAQRRAMLAAMYQDEPAAADQPIPTPATHRARKIRVGSIEYDVPTVEYVNQLEQLIHRQARSIERLSAMVGRLREERLSVVHQIDDLESKVNKRGTP